MNERISQNNILSFEEIAAKRESDSVRAETQVQENNARMFVQHNPELLLPFIRVNEDIFTTPGVTKSEKELLRSHMFKMIEHVFDAGTYTEASMLVDELRESFHTTERTEASDDVFASIENLTVQYLQHIESLDSEEYTPAEVISIDGSEITPQENVSIDEMFKKRADIIFNNIQEFYRHVEKSSTQTSERNNNATLREINTQAEVLVERLEQLETEMKIDSQDLLDSMQERFIGAEMDLEKIIKFVTNNYE